jgi:hypothetical protein
VREQRRQQCKPHAKRHRNAAVPDDPFADGSKFGIQVPQIPRNNERDVEEGPGEHLTGDALDFLRAAGLQTSNKGVALKSQPTDRGPIRPRSSSCHAEVLVCSGEAEPTAQLSRSAREYQTGAPLLGLLTLAFPDRFARPGPEYGGIRRCRPDVGVGARLFVIARVD